MLSLWPRVLKQTVRKLVSPLIHKSYVNLDSLFRDDNHYFNLCLTHFNVCLTQSAMPRQSDDEDDIHLPSDPDYITPPTDGRKCGAERVSFSGEGSSSLPSPVKQIEFEMQTRAQEQSVLCAAHITGIAYRPALRYPTSNSIPSPVKRIQAPQSQVISDDDDDYEWKVIAEYATNNEQAMDAYEIVDDIYRHAENFMHGSGTVMQPDYVCKPEDLYLWCLIGETKTLRQYACPIRYSCGCDTGIRITETKQSLKLETIGVHVTA
jgi:hypothetical protein